MVGGFTAKELVEDKVGRVREGICYLRIEVIRMKVVYLILFYVSFRIIGFIIWG